MVKRHLNAVAAGLSLLTIAPWVPQTAVAEAQAGGELDCRTTLAEVRANLQRQREAADKQRQLIDKLGGKSAPDQSDALALGTSNSCNGQLAAANAELDRQRTIVQKQDQLIKALKK